MATALDGALQYIDGAWQWRTGEYEPRVRSMRLQDLAPSFRVSADGQVEIPKDWRGARHWPGGKIDQDALEAIERLTARPMGMVYAEDTARQLDDHRLQRPGYLIPLAEWDEVMGAVIGCWWDQSDESAIIAKAREVRGG